MPQAEQVQGARTPEGDEAGLVPVHLPIPQEIMPSIPPGVAEQAQLDPRFRRTQAGIVVPKGYEPGSNGILLLPARATPEVIAATKEDQAQFGQKQNETQDPAERARAIFAPGVFLASKIGPHDAAHDEVVHNLAAQNDTQQQAAFTEAGVRRKVETARFYDKNAGAPAERTVVRPSALEDVSLSILDILGNPDIRGAEAHVILQPILKLVRGYNRHNVAAQTLELPGLRERILTMLAGDTFAGDQNRDSRYALYSILENIDADASAAHREALLWSMGNRQDLDHPLAAKHTFALAAEQPQSAWIVAQQELRRHILTQLGGSNQQTFDSFQQLYELSRGLVFHGDPLSPEAGKIGIDMECRFPGDLRRSAYTPPDTTGMASSENYPMRVPGLEKNWTYHTDAGNDELARGDNRLEHGMDYPASLVELYEWLNKNHVRVVGWHPHLDREQHPHAPTLGNILISSNGLQAIRENDLGTYEIRALQAPHDREAGYAGGKRALVSGINIHPARMDDIIALYIYAGDQPSRFQYDEKIDIGAGTHLSTEQLLWGHFASYLDSPEGRLAALMALHEPDAFASFNPVAFLNSYKAASLGRIADHLDTSVRQGAEIDDKTSRQTITDMLTLVRAAAEGQLASVYDTMERGIAKIALAQTLDADIPGNWDIYTQLIESSELRHTAVDALLRQPEQNATRLAPILQIRDFYGRGRVFDAIVPYLSDTDGILEEALVSDDYTLAQSALQVATSQPGQHQQLIQQMLTRDNPNSLLFRYNAFNTLCQNPVASHDLIAPYLHDPSGQFFHIVFSAAEQHPAEFRSELLGILDSEADSYIKGQAVAALGRDRTENHTVLASSLQSNDYAIATSALQAVLPYAEEFIPELERALQSDNYTVQTGAATYFAQHADKHMPLLEGILLGQNTLLQRTVLPVFTADPIRHEHILNSLRQNPDSSLRQAAVEAFAQNPQQFRGILLEELSNDQHGFAAATALTALAKDPQNTELFRGWLEDPYVSWDTLTAAAGGDPAIRQLLPAYMDSDSFVPGRVTQTLLERPAENLAILEQLIEKVRSFAENVPQIEATLAQASEDNPALVGQLLASNNQSFRNIAEREVLRHPRRYPNFAPQIITSANPNAQPTTSPNNAPPARQQNGIVRLFTAPFRLFGRRKP